MSNFFKKIAFAFLLTFTLFSCKDTTVDPLVPNSEDGNLILYTKLIYNENNKPKSSQAWIYNLDTDEKKMIADSAGFACKPVNGHILLGKTDEGVKELYLARTDGSIVSLIGTGDDYNGKRYILTPDLKTVIMSNTEFDGTYPLPQFSDIYTFDINGANRKRIFRYAAHETTPVLSPDGTKLAVIKANTINDNTTGDSVFVINIDGTGVQFVMDGIESTGFMESFDWSPDGQHISAVTYNDPKNMVITSDMGLTKNTLTTQYSSYNQFFSPNSKQLVFSIYTKNVHSAVGIINVNGTGYQEIITQQIQDERAFVWPTWSSDATKILVCDFNAGSPDPSSGILKLVEISTGAVKDLDSTVFRGYFAK